MKNLRVIKYLCLFVVIILCNCTKNKTDLKNNKNSSLNFVKDSIKNDKTYNVDTKVKESTPSMYNNKYLLRVLPDSTFSKENMNYKIVMTLKSDTIINYDMNIDSINKNYYKKREEIIDKIDFKSSYYLSGIDIKSQWARTENFYLYAKLKSKTDTTTKKVMLKFKYMGKQSGKLFLDFY